MGGGFRWRMGSGGGYVGSDGGYVCSGGGGGGGFRWWGVFRWGEGSKVANVKGIEGFAKFPHHSLDKC